MAAGVTRVKRVNVGPIFLNFTLAKERDKKRTNKEVERILPCAGQYSGDSIKLHKREGNMMTDKSFPSHYRDLIDNS